MIPFLVKLYVDMYTRSVQKILKLFELRGSSWFQETRFVSLGSNRSAY